MSASKNSKNSKNSNKLEWEEWKVSFNDDIQKIEYKNNIMNDYVLVDRVNSTDRISCGKCPNLINYQRIKKTNFWAIILFAITIIAFFYTLIDFIIYRT